jgi:hypothetical protein
VWCVPVIRRDTELVCPLPIPPFAGRPAAYSAPSELNIETRSGSPTTIHARDAVSPFTKDRRESLTCLVMVSDMNGSFRIWKFPQP